MLADPSLRMIACNWLAPFRNPLARIVAMLLCFIAFRSTQKHYVFTRSLCHCPMRCVVHPKSMSSTTKCKSLPIRIQQRRQFVRKISKAKCLRFAFRARSCCFFFPFENHRMNCDDKRSPLVLLLVWLHHWPSEIAFRCAFHTSDSKNFRFSQIIVERGDLVTVQIHPLEYQLTNQNQTPIENHDQRLCKVISRGFS